MRPYLTSAVLVLAIFVMVWRPWDDSGATSASSEAGASTVLPELLPSSRREFDSDGISAVPNVDLKRSPLADGLNAAGGTIRNDLETVQELFAHYRSVFKGNPTGSNYEMTSALSGNNSRLFAPIPRDHAAINKEGELIDRWRTPFFFHSLSAEYIEIRSAGPDRRLWTDDDRTLSNAPQILPHETTAIATPDPDSSRKGRLPVGKRHR